jgi:hypothetical protein
VSAATLLVFPAAGSASAGTGPSASMCDGTTVPVVSAPVTVALRFVESPTDDVNRLIVCYSTTADGAPGGVTGGAIYVDYGYDTGTPFLGAYANAYCLPDPGVVFAPSCTLLNGVFVNTAFLPTATVTPTTCILSLGATCLVFVPGIHVDPGTAPWLADVILLGRECPLVNPAYIEYCVNEYTQL